MRVLGIDPGAHLAWCDLRMGTRPSYVASGTIEVGHQVERRSAKGCRMERAVSDADLAALFHEVYGLVRTFCESTEGSGVVGVERILRVHPTARHEGRTGQSIGTAIGTGLVTSEGAAWAVCAAAHYVGLRFVTVAEATWRKDLGCAPPRGVPADAWIGRVIPGRIDGWPGARTPGITAHVRDAAGVAEWVGTKVRL